MAETQTVVGRSNCQGGFMTYFARIAFAFIAALALQPSTAHDAHGSGTVRYEVIPAGPPITSNGMLEPVDLNNRGELIGEGFEPDGFHFIWDCYRGRTNIPFLPNTQAIPSLSAISDAGQVVGHSHALDDTITAFIWDRRQGTRALLPADTGSTTLALDINTFGQVLGIEFQREPFVAAPFVWSEHFQKRTALPTNLNYSRNNDRGLNAAWSSDSPEVLLVHPRAGARRLAQFPTGSIIDSIGDINDRNDVVGSVFTQGQLQGFVARRSGEIELFVPAPGTRPSIRPMSINNRRQVVGASFGLGSGAAFIWDEVNGLRDLTEVVRSNNDDAPTVRFDLAVAVNDIGWIAARGFDDETHTLHAYVLVPVAAGSRVENLHRLTGSALCRALRRTQTHLR
jgi:hypothetical protein